MKKRLIIEGYGTVAKELVKLILSHSDRIKEKYQLEFAVTGIIGSKGMIFQKGRDSASGIIGVWSGIRGPFAIRAKLQSVGVRTKIWQGCSD